MGEFDFSVWQPSLPFIRDGLLFTLRLTLVAMTGGIVIGTLLALARLSPIKRRCRCIAGAYVDTDALDPAGDGDPLVLPRDSLSYRIAGRRGDFGDHHLHRLRGGLSIARSCARASRACRAARSMRRPSAGPEAGRRR
jgi:hypothetical protein